jgi:hypothetical protein
MLVGSVVTGNGAINAGGGGGGRFILGTNAPGAFPGTVTGASQATTIGAREANPFASLSTPFIPHLTDGVTTSAEIYGLADATLNQATISAALGGSLPAYDVNGVALSQAGAALVRLHPVAGTSYGTNLGGFDLLVDLNLSDSPMLDPAFGISHNVTPLRLRGYTRNPAVGGTGGPVLMTSLSAGGAYVTMISGGNGAEFFAISGRFGDHLVTASNFRINAGQVIYLPIPEPHSRILGAIGAVGVYILARKWRR